MSSGYGLTSENLLRTLPDALKDDERMLALASGIADILAARPEEISRLLIYTKIDTLPEVLLDILAYDFKVDWWDGDYTVAEKRQILKDSWYVHRHLGTKSAVEKAISALYPDTTVAEWFEYDGDPYHFKLLIDITYQNVDPTRNQQVLDRVNYYKNLRSILDEVEYVTLGATAKLYSGAAFVGGDISFSARAKNY